MNTTHNIMATGSITIATECAAETLTKFVKQEASYCDLSLKLGIERQVTDAITKSGLSDNDYPNIYNVALGEDMTELLVTKRVPLPNELVEYFARMQCNCIMGMFADIQRAWLSIDNHLFVWNYNDGGDLAVFDGLNETILACALVKPVAGVFKPHISHLLVLATPVELVLLGVTFKDPRNDGSSDGSGSDMHLLPDPLFNIHTDNASVSCIVGTDSGRIFMGARDGYLYEITYQGGDGWFGNRCKKVNLVNNSYLSLFSLTPSFLRPEMEPIEQIDIDETRNILYVRTDKGSIQVWDLGSDGRQGYRVTTLNSSKITAAAVKSFETLDQSYFENIVHISSVKKEESFDIDLVAVTAAGVRLYFAVKSIPCTKRDQPGWERPQKLSLVHVRLPPGFSNSTQAMRPSRIHIAHYGDGNLLMVSAQTDDVCSLWSISSDSFPFLIPLAETQMSAKFLGRVWSIVEEPGNSISWFSDPSAGIHKPLPPLVSTQHMSRARQYVMLSGEGTVVMKKLRPVDQLRNMLINLKDKSNSLDSSELRMFFKIHGDDQACATCLILACSRLIIDAEVSELATGAFFTYGGEPGLAPPSEHQTQTVGAQANADQSIYLSGFHPGPGQISTPMPAARGGGFSQGGGLQGMGDRRAVQPEIYMSGKHNGVYLYLSRIVAPLWNSKLVIEYKDGSKTKLVSRVSIEDLDWFLQLLDGLHAFLKRNSDYLALDRTSDALSHSMRHSDDVHTQQFLRVEAVERNSMQHLIQLNSRCIEILNVWKIVCEHQFHAIAASLAQEQQNTLKNVTLADLVAPGSTALFAELVQKVVDLYHTDKTSVDSICSRLRTLAPTLYSIDDAKSCKAAELLHSLHDDPNNYDKQAILENAMTLYKSVTPNLDLSAAASLLASVRHYDGLLDLCVITATRHDSQGAALRAYKSGEEMDPKTSRLYNIRLECYDYIFEALKFLMNTSYSNLSSSSIPTRPGAPQRNTKDNLSAVDAERMAERLYAMSLKTSDELFHHKLYDWMLTNNMSDKLLQVDSPFIQGFFEMKSHQTSGNLQMLFLDLLWRFHEKRKNFSSSAKILNELAERKGGDVNLTQRIEYLSRAVMSAKSVSTASDRCHGDYLHELEDKLEVARIQKFVLNELEERRSDLPNAGAAITSLNSQLFDVTTLYGEYAERFSLAECQLTILRSAGHYDSTLISHLWSQIINNEFEKTTSSDPITRMAQIQSKLVDVIRRFVNSEKFLPLSALMMRIEINSVNSNFRESWAYQLFLKGGVSSSKLYQLYDQMYEAKDPCWKSIGRPNHLPLVICSLLQSYLDAPQVIPYTERTQISALAMAGITSYLIDIQSQTLNVESTDSLNRRFRTLRSNMPNLTKRL